MVVGTHCGGYGVWAVVNGCKARGVGGLVLGSDDGCGLLWGNDGWAIFGWGMVAL